MIHPQGKEGAKTVKWLRRNIHWLFFGAAALLTIYMDVYVARHFPDGDASQLLWHGWMIAREGSPFTNNLYHTTEPRLLDIATVFAFFFTFLEDWTLVRILGTVTAQAVYVLAFLYLCKQARISLRAALISAGFLLLPFSTTYARIVLYHAHYTLYFANAFWIIGLTIRLVDPPDEKAKKPVLAALLLAGLWFFVGLNGVRHMMILGIPMLLFAAIQLLRVLNGCELRQGRLVCERSPLKTAETKLLLMVLASCLCFLAGYMVGQRCVIPYFDMESQSAAQLVLAAEPSRYTEILRGWLIASGVRDSQLPMIGIPGLSLVTALFSFGYLLVLSLRCGREEKALAQRLISGLMAVSFAVTTLILIFESGLRYDCDRFYLPVLFLAFPLLALEVEKICRCHGVKLGRAALCGAVCMCLLFQSACTVWFLRVDKDEMDHWNGLEFQRLDVADELMDCAAFLQQNDYTHAMIYYWWATPLMEMTDGEYKVAAFVEDQHAEYRLSFYKWGNFRDDFVPENLPPKMLVFVRFSKAAEFERQYPNAVLKHDGYAFKGYEIDTNQIEF